MKIERTWYAADKTGFHMLHSLFQTSLKFSNVIRYDEWFVTKILVENGRCQGVIAIELRSGKVQAIASKAVIICTGGAGRIFPFTTNGAIKTGDGLALAYRVGIAAQGLGIRAIPPNRASGYGNSHHRSCTG
jgi:fumarate reductase flavoprotein subunit